jgi:hypothetical protein
MHENSLKPSALDPATVLQLPAQPQLRPRARVNELNSRPIAPPPYRGKLTDISSEMGGPQNHRFPSPKLRLLELPKIPRH